MAYAISNIYGEVSEWSKVLDSKSSEVNSLRGFESHPLCQSIQEFAPGNLFFWRN